MTTIQQEAQRLDQEPPISLYTIDLTPVGGTIQYFVQATSDDANVVHNGIQYTPVDMEFTGLTTAGSAALPTPTIRIANTSQLPQALVNTWGDLLGCNVTRIRTFKNFLDGEADADPTAYYGPDIFRIERKVSENPIFIEWQLSASIDQEGKMLPARHIVRETCLWKYRVWNGSSFDYSKAQCPYTDSNYYDKNGAVTTNSLDRCGRKLSDCKLRFGADQPLPFGGFPGVGRVG